MSELSGISERPALISVVLILLTAALGFLVIGPLLGFFIAMPFYDGTLFELAEKISNPTLYPEIKIPVLIIQGSATLIGLILIPSLYLQAVERENPISWIRSKSISWVMVIVTAFIVLAFMAPNSVFIEWNTNFTFPEFLKEFGVWAREREDLAEKLTKFFVTFDTTGEFLIGIFVIALVPAIGEELVFRGMLQPELFRATGNHHTAIWISAIIFSAFHMQFFGFLPRMLLGGLFGYLYLWSGNLFMPILAHFINNGFSVLMMYLFQKDIITIDMESTDAAPLPIVAGFTVAFVALLFYFKKFYETQNQSV